MYWRCICMINKIEVLAADVDMTLSAKSSPLPEITIQASKELHKRNVKIGLATGREITEAEKTKGMFWTLGFEFDFIIGMNGGMIYDRNLNKTFTMDMLSVEEMKEILTFLMPIIEENKVSVNVEGNQLHNVMNINNHLLDMSKRRNIPLIDKTGDIDGFCEKPVYKFLFRTDSKTTQLIRNKVEEHYKGKYQTIETFPGTIELMYSGFSKGKGLEMYCEWNQINLENTIAFGDNENDNSLLLTSGWGVCLKDGNPNTKALADDITDYDCLEGGVGHYIFDHILKNKDVKF